jgi:hypothetical protein
MISANQFCRRLSRKSSKIITAMIHGRVGRLPPRRHGFARKEKADILRFTAGFYPEARTSGRLALAIDHLWNEYSCRLERPDHEPPRYLGRSGPQN